MTQAKNIDSPSGSRSECSMPCPISGVVKHYAWGKRGRHSFISQLIPEVEENQAYAELWFGAHPSGASPLVTSEGVQTLADFIRTNSTASLGAETEQRFTSALPFMFKVLSIEKALSLQVHPSRENARRLHRRDHSLYPDDNHKPEIAIALSPVRLLYGFKSIAEIHSVLRETPELAALYTPERLQQFESAASENAVESICSLCETLLRGDDSRREHAAKTLLNRITSHAALKPEYQLFQNLAAQYPLYDPGLFLALFMNEVRLSAGEAVYVSDGIVHAYLSGDLAECMANSDNVVRAGLTEKHRDLDALFEVAHFSPTAPRIVSPRSDPECPEALRYDTPAAEFATRVFRGSSRAVPLKAAGGPQLVVCLSGKATASCGAATFSLNKGGALFIPACSEQLMLTLDDALLFCIYVPL